MSLDATLDTVASLSAVRADLIYVNRTYPNKTHQWEGPPVNLADSAPCIPDGVTWLSVGFMNERFYQRFAIIRSLSSPFMLGMDFMTRVSISIHVLSRTVFIRHVQSPARGQMRPVFKFSPARSLCYQINNMRPTSTADHRIKYMCTKKLFYISPEDGSSLSASA